MTPREVAEFTELRATIRQRGSARVWLFLATLFAWTSITIATTALSTLPLATFLPLLTLAGGFEAVFQLHTGVERVGRYLQVFYEDSDPSPRDWERAAMAYGRANPGGPDALFTIYFCLATVLNFVPVLLLDAVRVELAVVGAVHLAFVARLLAAHRASGRQRAIDLELFRRIKQEPAAEGGGVTGRVQS